MANFVNAIEIDSFQVHARRNRTRKEKGRTTEEKWFRVTMQDLWVIVKNKIQEVKYASDFDYKDQRHVDAVHAYVATQ